MPRIREQFGDEEFYFQQDGAPPHYHRDMRAYLTKICRTDGLGEDIALNSPHVDQTSRLWTFFMGIHQG